jgi:predicted glycosyltransferase
MEMVLYNSASRGAGQYVRSLKIANLITSCDPTSKCTILAGNSIVERVIPSNTNVVQLPQIWKSPGGRLEVRNGAYDSKPASPRELPGALAERREIINYVIDSKKPDLLIVDSRAAGLSGEIIDTLIRTASYSTRRILLYRDIVDSPALTRRRWREEGVYRIMETLYESVVFLGEQWLFDSVANYDLWSIKEKVHHLGFLGACSSPNALCDMSADGDKMSVLVAVGGGYDGGVIIDAVCRLLSWKSESYDNLSVTITLGAHSPLKHEDLWLRLDGTRAAVRLLGHLVDLGPELCRADVVISMCGYNSLFELVEARKKVIAVPRTHSGCEQLIRARLLREIYDGLWVVPQDEVCPERLAIVLSEALAAPRPKKRVPMNGPVNLARHLLQG